MNFSGRKIHWTIVLAPLLWGGLAHAQNTPKLNPFDETCALVAQFVDDTNAECLTNGTPQLRYDYNFGSNTAGARLALESLKDTFGEPDSIRGTNHVWRIENPEKSARQKKTVTIVFTHNTKGASKIMMDRVPPGSVSTQRKRVKAAKPINQKANRSKPKKRSLKSDVKKNDVF